MFGTLLAWLFTVGMFALGVTACVAPRPTSALYGVPQHEPGGLAWVRASGLRDLGLCLILGWFLTHGQADSAAVTAIATGLVAATDLLNVVSTRGLRPALALAVHTSGIVAGIAAGGLLLAGI